MILVDTNVVVRYFIKSSDLHYVESKDFFSKVEDGSINCKLEQIVIAEVIYVLKKVYGVEKEVIAKLLVNLLSLDSIFCDDKEVMLSALDMYAKKSIDFADAILCAKANQRGFEVFSFDNDVKKCTKKAKQK